MQLVRPGSGLFEHATRPASARAAPPRQRPSKKTPCCLASSSYVHYPSNGIAPAPQRFLPRGDPLRSMVQDQGDESAGHEAADVGQVIDLRFEAADGEV